MAEIGLKNRILKLLNCSICTPESEHLCENPLTLSCGHYICKECLPTTVNHANIKCNKCGETNKKDLNQVEKQHAFDILFEENITQLFKVTLENFQNTFKTCKDIIYNYEERIDNHIQFIRDTILIHIESAKIELDNLYEAFNRELNEIGKKWKFECKEIKIDAFDIKAFEKELNELEKSVNENINLNQENIYKYQRHIKQVQKFIIDYQDNSPRLEFKENKEKISKQFIGELIFEVCDIDRNLIKRIEMNKFEQMNVPYRSRDLCELPNGNLLVSNYDDTNLQLYDDNMQPIRTITLINGKAYKIIGITSDENSNIYMCSYSPCNVIKTDSDFNQLAIFGTGSSGSGRNQVSFPAGICYYNESVYVCDYSNNRLQKLNSNLIFQASHPLDYHPLYIKNIKNVAVLRPNNKTSVYFYDLNTFNVLRKYDDHNGLIGASENYFYEYYASNKKFYCYNKNGELVEEIYMNGLTNSSGCWSSICIMKEKMFITNHGSNHITII